MVIKYLFLFFTDLQETGWVWSRHCRVGYQRGEWTWSGADIRFDMWGVCGQALAHGPLARYVNWRVAYAPGMPGTFSPPLVNDPDIHHDTCVTHVPWCMPGSLTSGFHKLVAWKTFQHYQRMRTRNFTYLARGPWPMASWFASTMQSMTHLKWCMCTVAVVESMGFQPSRNSSKSGWNLGWLFVLTSSTGLIVLMLLCEQIITASMNCSNLH